MYWGRKELKQAQVYGRKLTHLTKVYGRKFHHHAEKVGNHLIEHGGVYSKAIGKEIKDYGEKAGKIAQTADLLDQNRVGDAIKTLGFN
jgi:hypothetical protein